MFAALPVSALARFPPDLLKSCEISTKFPKITLFVSFDHGFDQPMDQCHVCGDLAVAHMHYGGVCCYSCKVIRVIREVEMGFSFLVLREKCDQILLVKQSLNKDYYY